ncbi:MAG: hybrid sensor histidine kinase/response regulator [Gammaproteobacteria bacterium]|nr:hybrid sensor histidine kinase/response regulator [Gammaproteobacteria bacterium]
MAVRIDQEENPLLNTSGLQSVVGRDSESLRHARISSESEFHALRSLHELARRTFHCTDSSGAAQATLEALISLMGADSGTVQFYDPDVEGLRFVAQRGFEPQTLDSVGVICAGFHSTCARALQTSARVVVEDFESDSASSQHRATAAALGYRAAQSTPLRDRNGALLGMITTHFRRPRKLSEAELRVIDIFAHEASHILERARADETLREEARRKDEFIAILAHELRNPLAPIRHAVRIARSKSATAEQIRWSHDVIDRQTGHMALLLDDLLDASRITRGQLSLHKEDVKICGVIDTAVEIASPYMDAKQHHLTIACADPDLLVHVDALRIAQVLANLLTNAAKYSEPGAQIGLYVGIEKNDLVIRVSDTGIGIEPEMLTRIFHMFAQANLTSHRGVESGLGIGLALVEGLVRLHSGTVRAYSEGLGRGSEFIVRLPLLHLPTAHLAPETEALPLPTRILRILVADDNRDAAEGLRMLLSLDGNEVYAVNDGEEVMKIAESLQPDVVLLDIGMPKLNGYEVARLIRAQPWGQRLRLVAITGWGQPKDRQNATDAGFDEHLTKPIDYELLCSVLAAPLGRTFD